MEKKLEKEGALSRLVRFLYEFNGYLVALLILSITVIMCIQVFIRYFLKGNLTGMEDYIYFFLMWMVFTGAGVAVFENTHLRSDTLIVLIKNKRFLNKALLVVDFIEVVLYYVFLYFSYLYILDCLAIPGRTRVLKIPNLVGQASVMYGAVLIAAFGLYVYVKNTQKRVRAFKAYRSGELEKYDSPDKLDEREEEA